MTESADISAINLKGSDTLTINGQGAALDGAYRGLFVYSGATTMAGGLFVANNAAGGAAPANVTLDNVFFKSELRLIRVAGRALAAAADLGRRGRR